LIEPGSGLKPPPNARRHDADTTKFGNGIDHKAGNGRFAQVRRKGFFPIYKSFNTKSDAEAWAREQESKADAAP